jgi:hypothetical protein
MKKLMAALAAVTLALCLAAQDKEATKPATAQLAGEWALSVDTPHGLVQGPLRLKEDGSGVSGTFEAEMFGTLPVKG